MKFVLNIFVLLTVHFISTQSSLVFEDCGSKNIESFKISNCRSSPCPLLKGTTQKLSVIFTSTNAAKSLKVIAEGTVVLIFGMTKTIAIPVPNPDACQASSKSSLICPLEKGAQYTYTIDIPVDSRLPKIDVSVKLQLVDENDNAVFCIKSAFGIVDDEL